MASSSVQLAIKGWTTSKLATSKDQGLESLLIFLEKKSGRKILSSRLAGRTVLLITINENDRDRFTHLNGFTFAGAALIVEDARPPKNQSAQPQSQNQFGLPQSQNHSRAPQPHNQSFESRLSQPSRNQFQNGTSTPPSGPRAQNRQNFVPGNTREARRPNDPLTSEVESVIISVIHKRYHAGDRHLILNTLVADPELLNSGLSGQEPSKVYKAIFAICETKIWETPSKRKESVTSVSLRDNGIKSAQDIISLSSVFPHLQNLDLSNNQLQDLGALKYWKNQFRDLQHLILIGNPVASLPDTLSTLLKWYPNLKMYNNEPVSTAISSNQQAFAGGAVQPAQTQPQTPAQAPQPGTEPARLHPEFPPGSTFGLPLPDKPADVLLREQMGLQFSFETTLKMQWVENCLSANNWDYTAAMANFTDLKEQGQIPGDAYIAGV
ncbi:nuclear mRNA export, poly(A)+RNA binding protein [Elasticomyces elasticus]|uniref:Nuclear mRNA export, poly(A)+RNA binding protein n=1 Tax=Exophiala sideris TaxID=1016849 RepID=A0ABR0JKR6_9EURO|nr:nuclear mRNA export, poly(A)+RNA binding protein [Elasticomyces elasticus]KAK5032180.1 nuclear mRNA export, poly(A)+RNA binding protein [Exophiala sideris]KAK5036178.1 nuclear mRNA export, poly(A)+RNA binding protein [Exophiala sideris]KAK5066561.1 nuclear mRNA export, poly(A)+RNA binding protein [Exophiala sideris]KAK5180383.1 nuclear mRNA export, poly(A)+RNA binding protein [Eurotiomycetes sp. CCFEE 6388]